MSLTHSFSVIISSAASQAENPQRSEKIKRQREEKVAKTAAALHLSPPTTNFLSLSSLVISTALCGSANHRFTGNSTVGGGLQAAVNHNCLN